MNPGVEVRLRSLQALLPVVSQRASLSRTLPAAQRNLAAEDAALVQALAYGVCRFYPRLQYLLSQLLSRPLKDLDVQLLLLLGLYQLQEKRIADYAVVDTCVAASKALNKDWAAGLINACLRRYQREETVWQQQISQKEVAHFAHPAWLLKKLKKAWPRHWQAICQANNRQPPMILRVNTRQQTREAFLQHLEEAGIAAQACRFSPWGVLLAEACNPVTLPGYQDGWFSVQDESAQLMPLLLDVQQGQRVLDACCAPGGKTTHLAELRDIQLLALDSDAQRLQRVRDNLQRLQLNAEVRCADASTPESWWDGQTFDRILLDAPCSATGVIRRHPDIKLLRRDTDIPALAATQRHLLEALWPLLKTGGKLLYATCSLLPEENQQQMDQFLYQHKDAVHLPIETAWGQTTRHGCQLFPANEGGDGFFYACLQKMP